MTAKVAGDDTKDKEDMPEQTLKQQFQPPPNLPLHKGEGWASLRQTVAVKSIKLDKAQTSPPPRYTEATLLTAMAESGKIYSKTKSYEKR